VKSNLADLLAFSWLSQKVRSSGTDFAAEDMKENICAIFVYIAVNFLIKQRKKVQIFKFVNTN